jgi:putative ABC transport system permease protein
MSVRERRHEYGVLKAIGFSPTYIGGFILGEGLLIGIVGGLLGLALVQLLINMALGPFLEENMASMFTAFRTPSSIMLLALGLAVILAVIAAVVPAISASKLKVTDALRRVD